ncbi:hypothetical protein [Streptomyces sp. NPDC002990]
MNRAALFAALDACGDTRAVALELGPNRLLVGDTALSAVRAQAEPVRIDFDPAALAPALEASVGPDVLLGVSAVDQLVLVRSADQGSFTTLVMPVALPCSAG